MGRDNRIIHQAIQLVSPLIFKIMCKYYRIEQANGTLVAEGYGTLQGAKLDARDISVHFGERLLIWDENNELYEY